MDWHLLSSELSPEALAFLRDHIENSEREPISSQATTQDSGVDIDLGSNSSSGGEMKEKEKDKKWLSATNDEYKEQWYWEERFKEEDNFEWLITFSQVERYLLPHLRADDKILIIGCGNSSLSADLYDREFHTTRISSTSIYLKDYFSTGGYQNIVNIDYSPTVISRMQELSAHRTGMQWLEMNMLELSFLDESFDVVLDKVI